MCDIEFDGACAVWEERTVRARKSHRCQCCGLPVEVGEFYLRHFSVYDGDASDEALCFTCWWVREEFEQEHGVGITPSGFFEMLRDCVVNDGDHDNKWRPYLALIQKRIRRNATRGPVPV